MQQCGFCQTKMRTPTLGVRRISPRPDPPETPDFSCLSLRRNCRSLMGHPARISGNWANRASRKSGDAAVREFRSP
jgi:hypothetical protein